MPEMETARVLLRPFTEEDLDAVALLMGNPEVMRYSLSGAISRDASAGVLERFIASYEKNGFGILAVYSKEFCRVVGYCGFFQQKIRGTEELEISYRLLPEFWGRGLATEAAVLVRDHGFKTLAVGHLIALIDPRNAPSVAVAKRLGMKWREDYYFTPDLLVHVYEVTNAKKEH